VTAFPVADEAATRGELLGLVRGERGALAAVLGLMVAATAAGLAGPWLLGRIIDAVGSPGAEVDLLAAAVGGFAVAQFLLIRASRLAAHRLGERATARLREQFVDRVLALPSRVVERAGTGDLVTRSTADVGTVGVALRDAAPDLVLAAAEALLLFTAVFVLVDPLLGVAGLVTLPVVVLGIRWYRKRGRRAYLAHGEATSSVAESMSATAEGARTVGALGLAEARVSDSNATIDTVYHARMHTLALRLRVFLSVDLSHRVAHVLVLATGGAAAFHGRLTVGEVAAAALYAWQLADPLSRIAQWLEQVEGSAAALSRIAGVATPPDPTTDAAPTDDRVTLTGVRFAYLPGKDVLHGIDLEVRPGERLAIVGPSGAGKSTVGRLIAGLERPHTGQVLLGGVPVADLDPATRNALVVLVSQEHHIFRGTLRDNLAIAAPHADDTTLTAALTTIGWPTTPDLDTPLTALPPDHAQLIALARVALRDPHTVVLDEATSVMDPHSARTAERALSTVLTGRTVIAIAHRLHTADAADRVAVVERGRITELGTPAELLAANGSYADLWRSWHG
jgi:ATP-binding cassette subfamily C protein